jgi:hypothetical protein
MVGWLVRLILTELRGGTRISGEMLELEGPLYQSYYINLDDIERAFYSHSNILLTGPCE